MLTHDLKAKIADFGLSTRIYIHTTERKGSKQNIVPFRWAAIEVFTKGTAIIEFSDVWSYGILMWEIFHLGSAIPYGDKNDYEEIIKFLKNRSRLGQPPLCPQYVYNLMLECWMENHLKRPTFCQLKNQLNNFDKFRAVITGATGTTSATPKVSYTALILSQPGGADSAHHVDTL